MGSENNCKSQKVVYQVLFWIVTGLLFTTLLFLGKEVIANDSKYLNKIEAETSARVNADAALKDYFTSQFQVSTEKNSQEHREMFMTLESIKTALNIKENK